VHKQALNVNKPELEVHIQKLKVHFERSKKFLRALKAGFQRLPPTPGDFPVAAAAPHCLAIVNNRMQMAIPLRGFFVLRLLPGQHVPSMRSVVRACVDR
jgi:hypothetical protein